MLEMLEKAALARLVLLRPFANAKNLAITLAIYGDRHHSASVMSSTRRTIPQLGRWSIYVCWCHHASLIKIDAAGSFIERLHAKQS